MTERSTTAPASAPTRRTTAVGVIGTTAVILPAFLTGALAVQIRGDLSVSEAEIGLAIGAFFVGSAVGSGPLGRLAERLGPRRAIRLGVSMAVVADLAVVQVVDGARSLAAVLVLAGLGNALTQPAINLALVRAIDRRRLGFAMALKQSGMPTASLLGGLAVPLIALTVGWRAAFLIAAGLATVAGALAGRDARPIDENLPWAVDPATPASSGTPDQRWPILALMAAVGVMGGGAANILVGYLVSGAVAAGVSPGPAGLLLTLGSAIGITSRLVHGRLADRGSIDALGRVVVLLSLGAAGALGLAVDVPSTYLLAAPVVFAAGWAWPGLFNLVVVNANRSAPAAATGVTQTGVYVGSVIGPIVAGLVIEAVGYHAAWLVTAGALAGAAVMAGAVKMAIADPALGETGREGSGAVRAESLPSLEPHAEEHL